MSKVFSFRLSYDNPREVRARDVISAWEEKGYSLRHVITEALLKLDSNSDMQEELANLLDQTACLLKELEVSELSSFNESPRKFDLSTSFIESIVKTSRSGIQY